MRLDFETVKVFTYCTITVALVLFVIFKAFYD
jgi:hypothetical protein